MKLNSPYAFGKILQTLRAASVILGFSVVLACSTASAQERGSAQKDRFFRWTNELATSLGESRDAAATAEKLVGDAARIPAFNLQALAKIYETNDADFRRIREHFKELEDQIGEYDKWHKALRRAERRNAAAAVRRNLEDKRAQASVNFQAYLREADWVHRDPTRQRLNRIIAFLDDYNWAGYRNDRAFVLDHMKDSLRTLERTEFDLTWLEHGNGLHELRREIRWFVIKARTLNGLLTFREPRTACPITAYTALVNSTASESRYASLPNPGPHERAPCAISACLFIAMADIVSELGEIKDEAEYQELTENLEDRVPSALRARAEALYESFKTNELAKILRHEINSCL